jgi:hypothetical protein
VLEAMGEAGGWVRSCPNGTDAECNGGAGGDPNDGCKPDHTCIKSYYHAGSGDQLAQALSGIGGGLQSCSFQLQPVPIDPTQLVVLYDGQNVQPGPGTWSYNGGVVTFDPQGSICQQLLNPGQQTQTLEFLVAVPIH